MYSDDKDFEQKRKMQKIFWNMGLWSRIDIPIVIYEDDNRSKKFKKHYVTDVDVYSEGICKDFSIFKNIADCKSGNTVKIFERLFWLKGVKEYYGADQAYLVKKKISSKAKIFMPKLDIIGIDDDALDEMQKIYHANTLKLFSLDYYKRLETVICQYDNEFKSIFDYLNSRYWFTSSNVSMRVLLSMLYKNQFYQCLDKNKMQHRFLLMEICIMFARTIIDCCRYVITRDMLNVEQSVLEFIHGGVDGFNSKRNMIREINNELKELLFNIELEKNILIEPVYFNDLVKIIVVILGETNSVVDILRYMEIMQHEIVLEKKLDYNECLNNLYSPIGHKLAKDIIRFYLKSNKIDINFFQDIFDI